MACILHQKFFHELTTDELYELLKVRCQVFIVEQQILCQELDDDDKKALHIWMTDAEGRLTFTHTVYERFLDMRRLGGVKHKRRRIHNRFVFGTYSSIAARLMYGFTQDVIDSIRAQWPEEK